MVLLPGIARRPAAPIHQLVARHLVFVATALIAAGCTSSSDESPTAAVSMPPPTAADSSTMTGSEPGATSNDRVADADRWYDPPFDLPFAEPDPWASPTPTPPPTTVAPGSTEAETEPTPATTSGSGQAPVTTAGGGGSGADVSIYRGQLGRLGRDEVVVAAVADPPVVAAGILPLTGLSGEVPNRPAAVVKIDNGSRARPQAGLNAADIVVEEEVEGGITRFAAVFHSTATIVGPIRSGRTTDIGVINSLGAPLLLYSGANAVTDALIRAQPTVQNRNAGTSSGYWRQSGRRAPSNLFSDTAPHWASASGGPPPPQFAYRADGAPVGGTAANSFSLSFRASPAAWSWDGTTWLRTQSGRPHLTASGAQVSAANVVVVEAEEVPTGMVDSSGSNVPEFVYVGSGRATVFTAGQRIEGTWTRPTLASVATLTDGQGTVIELTPGRTWVELIRANAGLLSG